LKVLAFDTTGPILTVGIAQDGAALGRRDACAQRAKGNLLDELIDRALSEVGWSRTDVEGLALVTGPGSLTATRIGWATAAGWAQATAIPIAGWPTPVVHHRQWRVSGPQRAEESQTVFFLVHHRGDSFYCYRFSHDRPPGPPTAVTLGQWLPVGTPPFRMIGPGLLGYRQRWLDAFGTQVELASDEDAVVGGGILAVWGEAELIAGRTLPVFESPLDYGLPPDFRRVNSH